MRWTLDIPGWHPTLLNDLLGHRMKAHRLKEHDKQIIYASVLAGCVVPATCKRRFDLLLVYPKGKRFGDKDAYWKSSLDALVACGALKNDSHIWVDYDKPEFARGESLRTVITLTDV